MPVRRRVPSAAAALAVVLGVALGAMPAPGQPALPEGPSLTWWPPPGIHPAFADRLGQPAVAEDLHAVATLRDDGAATRRQLRDAGLRLLVRLGPATYELLVPRDASPGHHPDLPGAFERAAPLAPEGKIDPRLRRRASLAPDEVREALVRVHRDVDDATARDALARRARDVRPHGWKSFRARVDLDAIGRLARLDLVRRVELAPPPFTPLNDQVRASVGTSALHTLGRTGAGVRIGIVDGGIDHDHPAFAGAGRLYGAERSADVHGTHVASIAGGGTDDEAPAELQGHAPGAAIGDFAPALPGVTDPSPGWSALMVEALDAHRSDVTNHSYVQSLDGLYDAQAEDVDAAVLGLLAPGLPRRPQVWAAGNNGASAFKQVPVSCEEGQALPGCVCASGARVPGACTPSCGDAAAAEPVCCCPAGHQIQFFSVFTSAKNAISVGAVEGIPGAARDAPGWRPARFSSLGPTWDGRIKPDLVAPGSHAVGDVCSTGVGGIRAAVPLAAGAYGTSWGTSMAAPVVTGILALMVEAQREAGPGATPQPATWKAMLAQTARDLACPEACPGCGSSCCGRTGGPDGPTLYGDGPDFATGFGVVQARPAVALAGDPARWTEDVVRETEPTRKRCLDARAGDAIRVTLAWDDLPGPVLQNDLDLSLHPPGGGAAVRPRVPPARKPLPCPHPDEPSCRAWSRNCLADPADGCPLEGPDPAGPEAHGPALEQRDDRNNGEQATARAATDGRWTVLVRAHRLMEPASGRGGPRQDFGLASSHALRACDAPPEPGGDPQDGPDPPRGPQG